MAHEPEQLRERAHRVERVARDVLDPLALGRLDLGHLVRIAEVVPEDRRTDSITGRIEHHEATHLPRHRDPAYRRKVDAVAPHEDAEAVAERPMPVGRILFDPPGSGQARRIGDHRRGHQDTGRIEDGQLAAARPDVDPEEHGWRGHARGSRGQSRRRGARRRPGTAGAGIPSRWDIRQRTEVWAATKPAGSRSASLAARISASRS